MIKKQQQFLIKGMNQDIAQTKIQSELAHSIKNLRVVTDEKDGTLSLVTEKGTIEKNINLSKTIDNVTYTLGCILGTAVIKDTIIIFGITTSNKSAIAKISNFFDSVSISFDYLYIGNLNFNKNNPIKTYVSIENEKTYKVYWIDGLNQPRVINIKDHYEINDLNTDNHFDFCSPVFNTYVNITKKLYGGFFHSGVIQYFFTYVDKNEQESKIFYQSPLYYITNEDRALSPEENGRCSFSIVFNIDNSIYLRKQIRCYSIFRTSLNSVPVAKLVNVINLNDDTTNVSFVDTGNIGYNIAPEILFAIGCEQFVPKTFAVKNNAMFFGNCEVKDVSSRSLFNDYSNIIEGGVSISLRQSYKKIFKRRANYIKEFQLNGTDGNSGKINLNGSSNDIKGFMFQEEYMLGIQFQHKNGTWTEPLWVADKIMTEAPNNGSYHNVPYFTKTISDPSFLSFLKSNGYVQFRPIVVCNDITSARVLCNGILNPTIQYKNENLNFYISSYFFRPIWNYKLDPFGAFTTAVYSSKDYNSVSNNAIGPFHKLVTRDGENITREIQGSTGSVFKISQEYVTFNSPEFEFEKIQNLSKNYKLLYSGIFPIHANKYDCDIKTNTTPKYMDGGFIHMGGQIDYLESSYELPNGNVRYIPAGATFTAGDLWKDYNNTNIVNYEIFPFENSISYTGFPNTDDIIYAGTENKTITNWRISQFCDYNYNYNYDSSNNPYFNSEFYDDLSEISLINDTCISLNEFLYYKDVDILFNPTSSYTIKTSGNDITGVKYPTRIQYKSTPHAVLKLNNEHLISFTTAYIGTAEQIGQMDSSDLRYSHVFNYHNSETTYTTNSSFLSSSGHNGKLAYCVLGNTTASVNDPVNTPDKTYSVLLQGTLINKDYDSGIKFFGRNNEGKPTETSYKNVIWQVAGPTTFIPDSGSMYIDWIAGDTYYQRYNCLKTYPYSREGKNNIIEIASVMIQTRVNIDGTYDATKTDILHIEPNNFNLLNDVYSQEDNFFTIRNLNQDFYTKFNNSVVWTKNKIFGEEIDNWCNINFANILDLNGNNEEITAIVNWNDNLLVFQNKAIYKLNYNENTVLSGQNGVPVVLQGSDKVTGATLVSGQFGCQNEWSIVNAKSGLYFSDDYNHKLYVLSDGIKCISDELGFKSYLKNKNYSGIWTPNRNAGTTLHTYYDQQLGDIYFTDGSSCLTYNESLNLFTSFYDYTDVYVKVANPTGNPKTSGYYEYINDSYTLTNDTSVDSSKVYYSYSNKKLFDFVNIENKNYWILNDFTNNTPLFFEHRASDSLNIFGNNVNYEAELTANIDPHLDKVFDTVEIRGDAYINNSLQSGYNIDDNVIDYNKNITSLPFDTIKVSNEYQDTGTKELQFTKDIKTAASKNSMKQKFRIWRAQIGRDATNVRDRIRNYWSRIKLTKNGTSNLRAKIHDIIVNVYE